MSEKIDVLDHGFCRLVDHMGNDLSVVRSARVSYDSDWRAGEDKGGDIRLINYLMKNQHTTPFEAVTVTFEIKAPIFVLRQWHRHRTQSYNEVSARYTELPEEFYVPKAEQIGVQSKANKQQRIVDGTADEMAHHIVEKMREQNQEAFGMYRALLSNGTPRELARSVLPCATYSHMFATMNLLNCFKFLKLRVHSHAQYEIRVYAEAMLKQIEEVYPVCVKAFKDHALK